MTTETTGPGPLEASGERRARPEGEHWARLEADRLAEVVRRAVGAAVGATVEVLSCDVAAVPYEIGTVSTCALLRATGHALVDDEPHTWSAFVKVLQSPLAWPYLHVIPEAQREEFIRGFPWRLEIDAHRSSVRSVLPEGLRLPELYDVVEADHLHAALWMEDVRECSAPWTLESFVRAAELLGELAGRRPLGSDVIFGDQDHVRIPGYGLRMYAAGRVTHGARDALRNDAIWHHPAMQAVLEETGETTLRSELLEALDRLPEWFERIEAVPATYVHGDASPQNLLRSEDRPDEFVVIDWGFNSPQAVGFDLGQLLLGLAHAGELDVAGLCATHEAIVPAYCEGLARAGFDATPAEVLTGYVGSMTVRSGFTAMPFESFARPGVEDTPELRRRLGERVALTRYVLELGRSVLDA